MTAPPCRLLPREYTTVPCYHTCHQQQRQQQGFTLFLFVGPLWERTPEEGALVPPLPPCLQVVVLAAGINDFFGTAVGTDDASPHFLRVQPGPAGPGTMAEWVDGYEALVREVRPVCRQVSCGCTGVQHWWVGGPQGACRPGERHRCTAPHNCVCHIHCCVHRPCLPACPPARLPARLPAYLPACLPACPPAWPPARLPVELLPLACQLCRSGAFTLALP